MPDTTVLYNRSWWGHYCFYINLEPLAVLLYGLQLINLNKHCYSESQNHQSCLHNCVESLKRCYRWAFAKLPLLSAWLLQKLFLVSSIVWILWYLSIAHWYTIVTFNTLYDDPSRSLSEVSCWRKGAGFKPNLDWKIQKDAVGFIGIDAIHAFSQAQCFSCWKLEYGDKHVSLFAIDGADSGFVLSLNAMQSLTGGQARELVRIDVEATQVDVSNCGISAAELHKYDF